MNTSHTTVAVLGLGRMGEAIAARLVSRGLDVVGWTRSGRAPDAVRTTGDPNDAVAGAGLVLLALSDAPACIQVLDAVRDSLRADTVVLNTGTVAPAEASDPARRFGPVHVHATAAALKLIADHSLDGAVLALRDALRQADALGTAEFTVGAPAKDMALPADASRVPLRGPAEPALPEADFALTATAPGVDDAVLEPLRAYIRGHAGGEPRHFREAFLPTAHVEGLRDGVFVSWPLDEYCALFTGRPAPDEASRSRRIDAVDVHGSVATATMTLAHGTDTFTDVFLLVRTPDGGWRIANKAYHRHP